VSSTGTISEAEQRLPTGGCDVAGQAAGEARRLSPGNILLRVMLICIAAAVVTVAIAISRPYLGLELAADPVRNAITVKSVALGGPADGLRASPGTKLAAIGSARDSASAGQVPAVVQLTAGDLVEDPDGLESYAALADFMKRQTELAGIISGQTVALDFTDNATRTTYVATIQPRARSIADLPVVFWVQLLSGLAGFAIGAWVWSMRRGDLAAGMFALSGVGLLLSALPAAIYSTRELAIDGGSFFGLSVLNHFGTHMFGGAMIALFLSYPRPLVRPVWLLAIPVILAATLTADVTRLLPDPVTGMYVPMLLEMLAIIALILLQRWLARDMPVTRAAMRWLGLSVVIGAGAFVAAIAIPLLLEIEPAISQGFAFAFFLLIYSGIALGIRRYRLFELGDWSFRILFYTSGAVVLLVLDAALIWFLHLERGPALGISLLITSFGYLPLRDALWRGIYSKRLPPVHELFAGAMEVAFSLTRAERTERWRALLARLYDPLKIVPAKTPVGDVAVVDDGLDMLIPPVADSPALRLSYPFAGKGMFGPHDLQLAKQLVALVMQADTNRDAYDRGVLEERQRIARDLHDDVGARLLTGLHSVDDRTRPVLHAALSDIRSIVSGLNGEEAALDRVLAEARHETARRLETVGIALEWPAMEEELAQNAVLDYRQTKALVSSVREIVSNVMRHAHATRVRADIALTGTDLTLRISDDGWGMPADGPGRGFGLGNVQRRVEEIGGSLTATSTPGGTSMAIAVPLKTAGHP